MYDADPVRCAALADKHGVAAFASQEALFAAVEAVIVACPAVYHEGVVRAALQAGCHVMVEKPLALTGYGADQLADLAEAAGLAVP